MTFFFSEQKSSRIVYYFDLTRHRLTDYVPAESIIRVLCIFFSVMTDSVIPSQHNRLYRFIKIVNIHCRCMHPPNAV